MISIFNQCTLLMAGEQCIRISFVLATESPTLVPEPKSFKGALSDGMALMVCANSCARMVTSALIVPVE